jgi:uncharacterized membrane protein
MRTGRLEAFSDGVFAIAITLLVLDIAVPSRKSTPPGELGRALAEQWPSYFAYLVSFSVIGIIWVNHHGLFSRLRQVDRPTLFANLGLLLIVAMLPFPTHLMAEYLTAGKNSHVAAVVYSCTMLAMGLTFAGVWLAVTRDERLLHEPVDPAARRRTLIRFGLGNVFYLITVGLAFVSAPLTLAVHGAVALYYCFDQLTSGDRAEKGVA